MLRIFTDGGARGNPGPSASAFVVYRDKENIFQKYLYLGQGTNNEAEYQAVILAHTWLLENPQIISSQEICFFLDSELVVKQLNGVYKIKSDNLLPLAKTVKDFEEKLGSRKPNYFFVKREKNKEADRLVNIALNEKK